MNTTIADQHAGLVIREATTMRAVRAGQIERDDAIGAGWLGLADARARYDPTSGLAFSTMAVPRIRGAVLDEIRRQDPGGRGERTRRRRIQRARARLHQAEHREPTVTELAAELGIARDLCLAWLDRTDAHKLALDARAPRTLSRGEPATIAELVPSEAPPPDAPIEREQDAVRVRAAVATLPDQMRTVVDRYYWRGLTMREVGASIGVTESRVSQIHSQAIKRLRAALTAIA